MRISTRCALKTSTAVIGVTLIAFASTIVVHSQKSKPIPLGDGPRIDYPSGELPKSTREKFLEGDFSIIKSVEALPPAVLQAFTEQGSSRLTMADPGGKFEATDFIVDATLPSKRLIIAGLSGDKCFVHYEQGGRAHYYVLALFNVTSKDEMKPLWKGNCRARAATTNELRSLFAKGDCL